MFLKCSIAHISGYEAKVISILVAMFVNFGQSAIEQEYRFR